MKTSENSDYNAVPVQERIDEEYARQQSPTPLNFEDMGRPASVDRAMQQRLSELSFLEHDAAQRERILQTRANRAANPEAFRSALTGRPARPDLAAGPSPAAVGPFSPAGLLKKEAEMGEESCWASIDSLTPVNEGPRMAQNDARSVLIAMVGLVPTLPTETQWRAFKEVVLSLPPAKNEE